MSVVVQQRSNTCGIFRSTLLQLWLCLRSALDLIIDKIFGAIYDSTRVFIPPTSDPVLLDSACGLAEKIKNKQLKVETVVAAYIERIKNVNGILNAVVDDRFDDALREAKELDKEIDAGNITAKEFTQKPFLGVPFTCKESTACKGLSNSFGLMCRKGAIAKEDADVVTLMKNAGGILLAVTNMPQLNLWQETYNPVFGITNNPYNTTRNVGGSSGGEASIIAACGSPCGIGTDIGGSIRIPCYMCGIFGHKISNGLTPMKGHTFRTGTEKNTMVVAGPMTRFAGDLAPLVKVLVGPNVSQLNLDQDVDVTKISIYYMLDNNDIMCSSIRSEVKKSLQRVVNHFKEISLSKPEKVEFEGTKYGGKLWRYWMTQEENSNFKHDITNREGEVNILTEILKFILRKSEYSLSIIFVLIDQLLPKVNEKWAREVTRQLKDALTAKLGKTGVLLYPSAPWPASYHYTAFLRPWNFNYFCIWNALQMPVTQVPLGLGGDGLPLGIQVVAAPYQDHLCIAVAKELEKAFGGYVPPFQVDK